MNCDVCGKPIKKQYAEIFHKKCCSDACIATLYDQEYDLPPGTTLNEILYRQAHSNHYVGALDPKAK